METQRKIMARYSDGVVVEVFLPIKRLISDGQGKTGQSKLPPVPWTSKRSFISTQTRGSQSSSVRQPWTSKILEKAMGATAIC